MRRPVNSSPTVAALENLEWLAFTRGVRAYEEFLKEEFPYIDFQVMFSKYAVENFQMDKDYTEWQGREYVKRLEEKLWSHSSI